MLQLLQVLTELTSLTPDVRFPNYPLPHQDFGRTSTELGLALQQLTSVHVFGHVIAGDLCECIPTCLLEMSTRFTVVSTGAGTQGDEVWSRLLTRFSTLSTLKRVDILTTELGMSPSWDC